MSKYQVELVQRVYYVCDVEAKNPRAARRIIRQQIEELGEPEDCWENDNSEMNINRVTEN